MNQRLDTLTRGALLHDIGKLLMRAKNVRMPHSLLGAQFVLDPAVNIPDREVVAQCVQYHHADALDGAALPPDGLAWIVYEADNIAACTDRRGNGEQGFDPGMPLKSVFGTLGGRAGNSLCCPADAGMEAIPYPRSDIKLSQGDYDRLRRLFEENIRKLHSSLDETNSILELLAHTASAIPASTAAGEVNDISLYSHSKLTAALACAMLLTLEEKGIQDYRFLRRDSAAFRAENTFLIVSGDLSGVQDFLYTITSKGALKSLRARSFYLEMLQEHCVDVILGALGLCRANLLYTGGGAFHLLLPNTARTCALLERARTQFNGWLLERFGTALYLALEWEPCSARELMNPPEQRNGKMVRGNLTSEVFKRLSRKMAQAKVRRYNVDQLAALMDPHSEIHTAEGDRECSVCRTSARLISHSRFSGDVCQTCAGLYDLGEKLVNRRKTPKPVAVVFRQASAKTLPLPSLGRESGLDILDADDVKQLLDDPSSEVERVYPINEPMTGQALATNLWFGDYVARSEDDATLEFEKLAQRSVGIQRLAVLRVDVDDLGKTFIAGFEKPIEDGKEPENRYEFVTLTRYAMLSNSLTLFFKHHINTICAKGPGGGMDPFTLPGIARTESGRNAVIVYAGGDDVFIVGAWHDVIGLSVDLYHAFRAYTGGALHFSAGIGMFGDSHPIALMAEDTGDLESLAKKQPGKNAVALFGVETVATDPSATAKDRGRASIQHVYGWQSFIDDVCAKKLRSVRDWFTLGDDSVRMPGKVPMGTTALYRLMQLSKEHLARRQSIHVARIAYMLGRLEQQVSRDDAMAQDTYRRMSSTLMQWFRNRTAVADSHGEAEFSDLHRLYTALLLVLYSIRRKQSEKEGR